MKRRPEESFEDYKLRRRLANKSVRIFRYFWTGGTYRKGMGEAAIDIPKSPPTNKASGKRHENEPWIKFRERRRICNTKRRQREKDRKY